LVIASLATASQATTGAQKVSTTNRLSGKDLPAAMKEPIAMEPLPGGAGTIRAVMAEGEAGMKIAVEGSPKGRNEEAIDPLLNAQPDARGRNGQVTDLTGDRQEEDRLTEAGRARSATARFPAKSVL